MALETVVYALQEVITPLKERLIAGLQKYPLDAPTLTVDGYGHMGLGVMAAEHIKAGTFLMPYSGDVITPEEFAVRNIEYGNNKEGSYYIEVETPYDERTWVVDGTRHYG